MSVEHIRVDLCRVYILKEVKHLVILCLCAHISIRRVELCCMYDYVYEESLI